MIVWAWCGLLYLTRADLVTNLWQQLSSEFGRSRAYFHSEQNDGEAWLIAERGAVIRRWIAEYPELTLGELFGVERHLLDAFGIPGKPEGLDSKDDSASSWAATWGHCDAPTVAAESSLAPRRIGPDTSASGIVLVAYAVFHPFASCLRPSVMVARRVLDPRSDGAPGRAEVFVDGAAPVAVAREHASGVEDGFIDADGVGRSGPLECWWVEPLELALPARPFASFKGQKNFTGEYWVATSRT
ncbi:hypothetical protein ACICHK_41345 (plasmid) [Streptomyces sp. AHU1]|uniref:hypothetical protein n=1 Tax=Streptomyces sp. AHU1 TaxID=3377215 RepID=UPI0038779FB0